MLHVRPFDPRDTAAVQRCIAELQSYEKALEDNRPDGEAIKTAYLDKLLRECLRWDGRIFVADRDGEIAGFACVLAVYDPGDITEAAGGHAFITDLVVIPAERRQGVGMMLLREAENFAREHGAREVRLNVLAANGTARSLYGKAGFRELGITMTRKL
jgi:ribosomal protein S18 acetylase RimI-like enzyme